MKISAIIFDLGGVLLNIDYNLSIKAFEEIGILDFKDRFSQANQIELFDKLETGKINKGEFCDLIQEIASKKIPNSDIINAWNAMLLDFPKERLELLKKVKSQYKCFLLSNTNIIHLQAFNRILKKQHNIEHLLGFFHYTYFSHEINMRKPDVSTFKWIIKKNELLPKETIFIDDSIQHVQGAQKTGLYSYLLQDEPIESLFDKNGVLLPSFLAKFN